VILVLVNDVRILRVQSIQLRQFYVVLVIGVFCGSSKNENFLSIVMTTAYLAIYSLFPSLKLRCFCSVTSEFVNYRLDACFVSFRHVNK
jgi:hypothetical protein